MHTPEFMPVLKGGGHIRPEEGACVMEYVSFIAGEQFSALPQCTPFALALLAQYVNDTQRTDEDRAERLLPLMPRLLGEGRNKEFDSHLANCLYEKGVKSTAELNPLGFVFPGNILPARGDAEHQHMRDTLQVQPLTTYILGPPLGRATYAVKLVELLVEALDEYDRFLGRTPTKALTEEQIEKVVALSGMIGG